MIERRHFIAGALPLGAALLVRPVGAVAAERFAGLDRRFAAVEAKTGGRLGVAVIDTETGGSAGYRAAERFAMCSTSKIPSVSAVLARVDAGEETLDRVIHYTKRDLVAYSPETSRHAGAGMTLAAVCRAAITLSDNTAANLLLANIGGPQGFTAYARRIGDAHTRLDRTETTLNEAAPGDPRDTTTPAAMARNLEKLSLGRALSPSSRRQLVDWLMDCQTGGARLRAGLPSGWRVGDKTGTGDNATANDVAIAWPPGRKPVIIATYLTTTTVGKAASDAAIAEVGRLVAGALAA